MSKEITISIRVRDGKQTSPSKHIQDLQRRQRAQLIKEKQLVTKRAELERLKIAQLTQQINRKNHTIDLSLALVRNQSGLMKLLEEQLKLDRSSRLKGYRTMTRTENNERYPNFPLQTQEHSLVLAWKVSRQETQIPTVRIVINTEHAILFYNKFGLIQEIGEKMWRKHPESLSDALQEAKRNPISILSSQFLTTDRNTFLKPQPLSR